MSSASIERDYAMDDLQMLQRAQIFHDGFVVDENDFENNFPMFADPYATQFQLAINAADAIPTAVSVQLDIKVITETLNDAVTAGLAQLQKLYTYVELIWKSKAKNDQFGRQYYSKLNRSQTKTKELLELAHEKAELVSNKPKLIAMGYSQAMIDGLAAARDDIHVLNKEQESMIADQKTKSEVRITAYNEVWDYMHTINRASKVVFADNPARLDYYLLYPSASESLPKPQNLNAVPDPQDPFIAILTWEPVPGATSYKIYFSEMPLGQPSGTFGEILMVNGVTIANVPIVSGKENYWKIKAYGGGLTSTYSNEVNLPG
jgi:hypothetical protein